MASTGIEAAKTAMKEFPNTETLHAFELERKKVSLQYARIAEEAERKRRIQELEKLKDETVIESVVSRAWSKLCEAEERLERMIDFMSLRDEITPMKESKKEIKTDVGPSGLSKKLMSDERELNRAYTIIKEEEERARRIAEESYLEEVNEEQSKDNRALSTIKEEEERVRRMAEDSLVDETQLNHSQDNLAYTIIKEEEERVRRMAEDSYFESLSLKRNVAGLKEVKKLEETERQRRLKEKPSSSQLSLLRNLSESVVQSATKKSSGGKIKIFKFKKPKHARRDATWNLEEKERLRRLHNPLEKSQLDHLRSIALMAALSQAKKRAGEEIVVNKFKKSSFSKDSFARLKYIKQLEEEERSRRIGFPITKEQKLKLKNLSHATAEVALKKLGGRLVILSKFKKPDVTLQLEEKERQRRMTEKLSHQQRDQLRKLAETVSSAASQKMSGMKHTPVKSKITKKPTEVALEGREGIRILEEKERQRRMKEGLNTRQSMQLKALAHFAANAASVRVTQKKKKRPTTYKKPLVLQREVTRSMEEGERKRRMIVKPSEEDLQKLKSIAHLVADAATKKSSGQKVEAIKFKKTSGVEVERKRRVEEKVKPDILSKIKGVAHNVKEAVEHRLAGQKFIPARFKKNWSKKLDQSRALEEQERQRRMTDKITPEQRNKLRVFAHQVVDEVNKKQANKPSKVATFKKSTLKGFDKTKSLEEQERKSRMSSKPSPQVLSQMKKLAEAASSAAQQRKPRRFTSKKTVPIKKYRLTEAVKKSIAMISDLEETERKRRLENPPSDEQKRKLRTFSTLIVKESTKKLSGQKLQPSKFKLITYKKPKKSISRSEEIKSKKASIPIRTKGDEDIQKKAPLKLAPAQQPLKVRKEIVDKLSQEMFDKISKNVLSERR